MGDLISRIALLGVLNALLLSDEAEQDMIERIIKYAPTVDAEPVARCKDCKWFRLNKTAVWCDNERGLVEPRYDSFCSYGERILLTDLTEVKLVNSNGQEYVPIVHGHWIERSKVYPDIPYDSTYNYECSNCGYMDTHGADVEVPYCWHCGAKMNERKEDEQLER